MRKAHKLGFSLIELLVIIVLLITITGVAVTKLSSSGDKAKEKVAKEELRMIYKAIMGDEKSITGYYHETRLGEDEKIPEYVAYLTSRSLLEDQFPNIDFTWDPNHRRGYRENGYILGDGIEVCPTSSGLQEFSSMIDPWGNPYIIKEHQDDQDARVVSYGPNGVTLNETQDDEDDIVLLLLR